MKLETKNLLALKFEGAPKQRNNHARNHAVAVLRQQEWGMELVPQGVIREERYIKREAARIARDTKQGAIAAYTRRGLTLAEARRRVRADEETANASAFKPLATSEARLTYNPFSGLEF